MNLMIALMFLVTASGLRAQESPRKDLTPEAVRAEIESLRSPKVAWREIQWRTCLLEAVKEARDQKKPVLLWVLGGEPADGRC